MLLQAIQHDIKEPFFFFLSTAQMPACSCLYPDKLKGSVHVSDKARLPLSATDSSVNTEKKTCLLYKDGEDERRVTSSPYYLRVKSIYSLNIHTSTKIQDGC